jgi:hypothetical protein
MPSKNAQKNAKVLKQQPEPEPQEEYKKMACGTQVRVLDGQTNFSCIGRTQAGLNCAEQCPFYYKKKQS